MPRLKDRNRQIPNGLKFYQPETGWRSPGYASFNTIVRMLISHRRGNPDRVQRYGWATDEPTVADEVDAFNSALCQKMGWNDYIMDGGHPPPLQPRSSHRSLLRSAGNVAAGAETLVEWIANREEAAPAELSEARAKVCVACPLNVKGDLLSFFTRPAADAVIAMIARRDGFKLSTKLDDQLGICDACGCVLKLKVHLPLARINSGLDKEGRKQLHPDCWILKEP